MKKAFVAIVVIACVSIVGVLALAGCEKEDTVPPQVQSIEVKETDSYHSKVYADSIKGLVAVVVKATDDVGIDSVVFFLNDTAQVIGPIKMAPDAGTTDQYTYEWNTMAPPLEDSTRYSIGAKVYDVGGNVAVSQMLSYIVRIPNNPPFPAELVAPDTNRVFPDAVVQFRWRGGDPDSLPPQAVLYDIYFGTSATNMDVVAGDLPTLEDAVPGADTFMTWSTSQIETGNGQFYLHPETDYYWMILTKDPYGQNVPSDTRKFSRGANNPPGAGTASPPGDSVQFIQYPEGGEITLRWSITDSDGDPILYTLYFGPDPGTSPVYAGDLPVEVDSLAGSSYKVKVSEGTTFYWRPIATDLWGAHQEPTAMRAWRIVVE